MSRASYHHGNLKETCVEIAYDIVCEEGIEAVRLAEIARRAGVSAPALYRHFASRDDLLEEVQDRVMDELGHNSRVVYQKYEAGSIEAVVAMATVYLDTFTNTPNLTGLMARASTEPISDLRRACFQVVREAAKDFLTMHPDVDATEDDISQSVWSIPHGICNLVVTGMIQRLFDHVDPEDILRKTLTAYLHGLVREDS